MGYITKFILRAELGKNKSLKIPEGSSRKKGGHSCRKHWKCFSDTKNSRLTSNQKHSLINLIADDAP